MAKPFSCLCGDKLFFLGGLYPRSFSCLFEFSLSTGKSVNYAIFDESPGDLVVIYALHGENVFGVIFASQNPDQIIQLIWKVNKKTVSIECVFERRFSFEGVYDCRIGNGTNDAKRIFIIGKNSDENGENFVTRSIAANPFQCNKYPDTCFNYEIAQLEELCKTNGLFIFYLPLPNFMPFINENGIYFLLKRIRGFDEILETDYIGAISLTKFGTKVEIITVKERDEIQFLRQVIGQDLFVEYFTNVAQRNTTSWMTLIVHKSSCPWRYMLQNIAIAACELFVQCIGRPLVSVARLDGGFMAELFANFYKWLIPGLTPNLNPTLHSFILALDLKKFQFRHIPFTGGESIFRSSFSRIMMDTTSDGSLITYEATPNTRRMRISKISNPFRIKPLYEIAFEVCTALNPTLSKNPALLRLQKIHNSGGCTLYSN